MASKHSYRYYQLSEAERVALDDRIALAKVENSHDDFLKKGAMMKNCPLQIKRLY